MQATRITVGGKGYLVRSGTFSDMNHQNDWVALDGGDWIAKDSPDITLVEQGELVFVPQPSTVCAGCGNDYGTPRGLRAHQSQRFATLACKPVKNK